MDGTSKKELSFNDAARSGQQELVAAAAFDKIHNKLFFSTMQTGQLRWIDLSEKGTAELKVAHYREHANIALLAGTLYNQSFVYPHVALVVEVCFPALRNQEQCQNVRFSRTIGSAPKLTASASA